MAPTAASAPTVADSPRRASFSWLQHAEASVIDDDWLRLGDEDDDDINCSLGTNLQLADFRLNASPRQPRLREADLTRVAADVGRRSFARPAKSGAPICSGTIQFANPAIIGIAAKKIIVVPCNVKNWLYSS